MDTFYNITEPGMVEVGVELVGNITFQTTFLVEVVFATATGIYYYYYDRDIACMFLNSKCGLLWSTFQFDIYQ